MVEPNVILPDDGRYNNDTKRAQKKPVLPKWLRVRDMLV